MKASVICASVLALFSVVNASFADFIEFDLRGNGGVGLLTANEIGDNTSLGSDSVAMGQEFGASFYDTDSGMLFVAFQFQDLSDGGLLFAAGSGIHIHAADPNDPFNTNGPIVFNLNSFDDPNVTNSNLQLADGTSSGFVGAFVNIGDFEDELLSDSLYINIHGQSYPGGELRANLVRAAVVPEPSSVALIGIAFSIALRRRRVFVNCQT